MVNEMQMDGSYRGKHGSRFDGKAQAGPKSPPPVRQYPISETPPKHPLALPTHRAALGPI